MRPLYPPGQPVRAEPGATRCGPDLSPGQARGAFRAVGVGGCPVPDSRCAASGMTRAGAVRAAEALWVSRGISGVPAVMVDGKGRISGGQPAEVFEEALRGMAGTSEG